MRQHTLGTARADTHLTDEQMRQLDQSAKAFYLRVLLLQHETGCSYRMAYAAIEAADKENHHDH